MKSIRPLFIISIVSLSAFSLAFAADWPQWGGGSSRNMVSSETGLPDSWSPGKYKGNTEEIDMPTTKNVKWIDRKSVV